MRYRLAQTIESTDEDTTIVNKKYVDDIKTYLEKLIGKTPEKTYLIGGISDKSITVEDSSVSLKWSDPSDIIVDDTAKATWTHTVIVKKNGSIPTSPSDGTVVVDSSIRDQYATEAYVDMQENPENWYYRAFPYQESGEYNTDLENIFHQKSISYGFTIDQNNSDESTCVSYITGCDNENYEKAYMDFDNDKWEWGSWKGAFFIPKPCMLKYDGTVDYYLDPDDYTKKEDGTASDIYNMNYEGNAMMQFPKMYYKSSIDTTTNIISVYISDKKVDDDYECFSCLKSDGTYNDYFYVAIYEGYAETVDSSTYRLRSICPQDGSSATTGGNLYGCRVAATNNGSGWDIDVLSDYEHIRILAILMCKRLNFKKAVSCGVYNNGNANIIGIGNKLGMFYGRETSSQSNEFNIKFFGIENLWGNCWRFLLGVKFIQGAYYIKMTKHTADGSLGIDYIEGNADNYITNYIKNTDTNMGTTFSNLKATIGKTVNGTQKYSAVFLPAITNEDSTYNTYYCSCTNSGWGNTSVFTAYGGFSQYVSESGLFSLNFVVWPSNYYDDVIASLTYRR